jgi:hypothetical protein
MMELIVAADPLIQMYLAVLLGGILGTLIGMFTK